VLAQVEQAQEGLLLLAGRVLRHQDGGRGLRARDPGVAMDQHVAVARGMQAFAERQHLPYVIGRAGLEAGILRHHVVEAHQLVIDLGELIERVGPRLVRVDDRKHMRDAGRTMLRQLGNAADRDALAGQGHEVFYSRLEARCSPTPSMPKMKILRKVSGASRRRARWPSQTPAMVGATAATLLTLLVR